MADSRITTGDPIDAAWSDAEQPVCPGCKHELPTEPYRNIDPIDGLMKLFGRPRAAMCGTPDETDPTGWSPAPCPCRNTFHGS